MAILAFSGYNFFVVCWSFLLGKSSECKVLLSSGEFVFNANIADNFVSRLTGIMFRRHFPYSALLFTDSFWIHSFFCFVNFHIVFLDKNFNIIETFYDVKPNKILPPIWGAKYTIEFFDDSIKFKKGDKLILENL